jgi:tetratricopeptide (TPR) repeat protein
VYISKYFAGEEAALSDAREQFQFVIDEYLKTDNERIKELASEAHARLGLLARQQADLESAAALYEKGLELASDHARRGFILITLADIYQRQGDQEVSLEYAGKAIEAYNGSLILTSDPELRANRYKGIAVAHTLLGETEEAVRAFEEALELLPEGDCEHIRIQAMLEEVDNR